MRGNNFTHNSATNNFSLLVFAGTIVSTLCGSNTIYGNFPVDSIEHQITANNFLFAANSLTKKQEKNNDNYTLSNCNDALDYSENDTNINNVMLNLALRDYELNVLVNKFLSFAHDDDDSEFADSDFLTEQYSIDPKMCIELIKRAFSFDSYRYANEVLIAVRFSEINYLQRWFKDILIEGLKISNVKSSAKKLYELYKNTFDKL